MSPTHPLLTDPEARARVGEPGPRPELDDAGWLARFRHNPNWVREPDDELVVSADHEVPGPAPLAVRSYAPRAGAVGALVFAHGGGWVSGDLDTNDGLCRRLAAATGALVVSVAYRLAPEHPYPAAIDDLQRALEWLATGASGLLGPHAPIGVAGHSAGGNLAAALALRCLAGAAPAIRVQVLLSPVLDADDERQSYLECEEGLPLTAADMRWFWSQYAPSDRRLDPQASPLRAPSLAGSAPAVIVAAEADPLRDEAIAYARRLSDAGVPTTFELVPGVPHLFLTWPIAASERALRAIAPDIARRLNAPQ